MVSKILPKAQQQKKKIDKLDFIKIKSLCISKDTIKKVKTQPTEWEKIFVNLISKKDLYPEYVKHPYNSTTKKDITQF